MNELNTIITLRQGTTADWADSTVVLKVGEMGLEYLTDGTVKIKAGDGENLWKDLPYVGSDVKDAEVYQSEILAATDTTDDIDVIEALIPEGVEVQNGDVAIVKRYITGTSGAVTYTSYVYDETVDGDIKWIAMDGNYSASNVFLKNKITLTSALGNYANGHTINAGTSLESVLSGLMQQEKEPSAPSKPTASIAVSGGNGEVGSEYTVPTAKLSVGGVGSYTYGPATGIVFNIGDVKLAEGADPAAASNYITNTAKVTGKSDNLLSLKATGDKVKYVDGNKTYTFSGSASYQAATAGPITNLGNPSKTQTAIAAGSCTIDDKTATFTGWRKMFMGAVSKSAEINSATIRGIGNATTTNVISEKAVKNSAKTFTAPVGTERILIAWPRSLSTAAPSVRYFTMSWEAFGDFALAVEKVKVADAAGVILADDKTSDEYIVYAYTPADPLKADTKFEVTLK